MLTAKQERFCQNLEVKRMSQREAYRDAYPGAKNYKPKTLDETACRLAKEDKILARRKELREEQASQIALEASWTRQDALNELKWLMDKAKEELTLKGEMSGPNVSALINAVKELNTIFRVGEEKPGSVDDGFIEALNGTAAEVWADEESGDIPV